MNADAKRKEDVSAVLLHLHINMFFFGGDFFLAWGPYILFCFFFGAKHGQTLIEQILSWL